MKVICSFRGSRSDGYSAVSIDVSKEHVASIFKVEEYAEEETSVANHLLSRWFLARLILRP
jgi:hypothetical protein